MCRIVLPPYAKRILYALIAAAFWLGLWEILACTLQLPFALPRVLETFSACMHLLTQGTFWLTVLLSLCRILAGLLIGAVAAVIFAVGAKHLTLLAAVLNPVMAFVRATPVASFILVLWVLIGRAAVPTVIGALMVLPIIYQNVLEGLTNTDVSLEEMLRTFRVSPKRRLTLLVIPGVVQYFFPAFITSAGLAWKAGIAAEIIAYTKNSIGRSIADAKNNFDGAAMFAWTIAVILLSFIIEKLLMYAGRRVKAHVAVYRSTDKTV